MKKDIKTVGEYIKAAPVWAQGTLREIRKAIKAAAPQAKESISYHVPYYAQNGRLGYFAAYTRHTSFHWISENDKKIFAEELEKQKVVGSTLQIPQGAKVPTALIKKIIKMRVMVNEKKKR
jgi:uncharacterized protein YdhG (YjbR/CyaY superfamily)